MLMLFLEPCVSSIVSWVIQQGWPDWPMAQLASWKEKLKESVGNQTRGRNRNKSWHQVEEKFWMPLHDCDILRFIWGTDITDIDSPILFMYSPASLDLGGCLLESDSPTLRGARISGNIQIQGCVQCVVLGEGKPRMRWLWSRWNQNCRAFLDCRWARGDGGDESTEPNTKRLGDKKIQCHESSLMDVGFRFSGYFYEPWRGRTQRSGESATFDAWNLKMISVNWIDLPTNLLFLSLIGFSF